MNIIVDKKVNPASLLINARVQSSPDVLSKIVTEATKETELKFRCEIKVKSIAFTIAGRFPAKHLFPYIFSQIAGGIAASLTLRFLFQSSEYLGETLPENGSAQSFVLELVLTFFMMLTIIKVATGSKEQGMFAGLVIGAVIALGAMFAGPICGASMNPARSIAPAIVSGNIKQLWIYIFAPILGGAISIPVSKILVTSGSNE